VEESIIKVLKELEFDITDSIVREGSNSSSLSRTLPLLNSLKNVINHYSGEEVSVERTLTNLIDEINILSESYTPYVSGTYNNISGVLEKGTDKLIAKSNNKRCSLIVQNLSMHPLFIEFGSAASPARSLRIDIGESFVMKEVVDQREIHLISTSASNVTYTAVEVTRN